MAIKVPFLDLYAQYRAVKPTMDRALARIIEESSYIGGEEVVKFENAFKEYIGMPYCVGCANGTDSLEILLRAFGVGPGDEVIVPALSWISTSESVSSVGAKPIFVDIDPVFYTIDPVLIEQSITKYTKAIIPVHLYGQSASMGPIMRLARKHKLIVIEDCAQAHGAFYYGKRVGSIGNGGSFSFYPGKNLGAYGDAGAMVMRRKDIATLARRIGNHGQLVKHIHVIEGRNSRLDGIQAAVLNVKLPYLDSWIQKRKEHVEYYRSLLKSSSVQLPQEAPHTLHAYHLFVVQVPRREDVRKYLAEQGIETSVHYPSPLPFLEAYRGMGYAEQDFPVSTKVTKRILSLPLYPELSKKQIRYVCKSLLDALGR